MNIRDKVSQDDRDNARIDRDRATNPAESDPGMSDSEFDWDAFDSPSAGSSSGMDDIWGKSGSSDSGGFGDTGGGFGSFGGGGSGGWGDSGWGGGGAFGGGGFGGGFGPMGQDPNQKKEEELEDKIFSGIGKFFKGFGTFLKEFVTSFKSFNYMSQLKMGRLSIIIGAVTAVIGLLLFLFGFGTALGLPLLVGGLLSTGVGVITFMLAYDTFNKNGAEDNPDLHQQYENAYAPQPEETAFPSSFPQEPSIFPQSDEEDTFGSIFPEEDDEFPMDFDEEDEEDEEDDDKFDIFSDDKNIDFESFKDVIETDPASVKATMDSTLENLDSNNGMYTRQYLYEHISQCLVDVNPNFDKAREIRDDTDEFDAWDSIIQNSAKQFKPRGNDIEYPHLISAEEKIFYYLLEVKRVNWLKNVDQFVTEIVNICAYDKKTGVLDHSIYGVSNVVGDRIYVKIMKGDTAMVSVKDAYSRIADDIKDTKNFMPIVLGIDAEGNIIWRDFKDINSFLVTGMPRSGKSWFIQSVISQMTFYLKPSELHFYVLDPKDAISDFKQMMIPHFRKFVTNDADILAELRNIVRIEGPRRKQIIGDAGFVNIWDYKKKNPDVEMPLLYVLIDEVITLAERMDKETKDEFQGLLLELVSQLPALGIRIMMIPHIVKDQILKKTITDLIPCRVSVRGDSEHIEKSVGVRNFKHKLTHQGDMAVRFNNDEPLFVHSAILTPSNEGNKDLFNFLTKFWIKLDPEGYEGSRHWQVENGVKPRKTPLGGTVKDGGNFGTQQPRHGVNITRESFMDEKELVRVTQSSNRKLTSSEVSDLVSSTRKPNLDEEEEFNLFD